MGVLGRCEVKKAVRWSGHLLGLDVRIWGELCKVRLFHKMQYE